jgi:hypothetical protein
VREVSALEQQWLARDPRQRVGKAISEIQPRRMPASFAKIPIRLPRDPCLHLRDRLDFKLRLSHEIIKAPAGNRVVTGVDDNRCFDEIGR